MRPSEEDVPISKGDLYNTEQLYKIFMESPVPIAILKGPNHIYELSNPLNNIALGVKNPVGKSVKELFPKAKDIHKLLDITYKTGKPFYAEEYPINFTGPDSTKRIIYVNATYQPLLDTKNKIIGVMTTGVDVTAQVLARRKVEENEQRLLNMFESVTDGFVAFDNDWRYVYLNDTAAKMAGAKREELIGKSLSELYPEKMNTPIFNEYRRIMRDGTPTQYEYQSPFTNCWIRANLYPSTQGMTIFMTDITDLKKIQDNQLFLEQASRILGTTLEFKKTIKNIAKLIIPYLADYCRIVVAEDKEIKEIAVHCADPKNLQLVKKLYKSYKNLEGNTHGVGKLLESAKSEIMPTIPITLYENYKNNTELIETIKELGLRSYMGVPLKIGQKVVGAITFSSTSEDRIYSQSDLKLAEELARRVAYAVENSRLYNEAQLAISLRDEFISVASHELKTPVTSLKLYAQYLQRQFTRDNERRESAQYIKKMNKQIDKLIELITDLLNVSRLQAGKFELHKETFDFNELVLEVTESVQNTAPRHHIFVEGSAEKHVWGDRTRIGLVLTNLMSNAINYSPYSEKIYFKYRQDAKNVFATVEDYGIGITKEHQKKIFSRFYRVNNSARDAFPGLGLGLYISNEIIQRHGGTLTVASEKGHGSSFSFQFPYSKK